MFVIDEAYYPERLEQFFMINAPWFFSGIWAVIRPWLDPITARKIQILGTDFLPTLREYIDDSQIPIELGGTRENFAWQFPASRTEGDEFLEAAKGSTTSSDSANDD